MRPRSSQTRTIPFFHVGAEVSIGSAVVNCRPMPNMRYVSKQQAAYYTSSCRVGALAGRTIGPALTAKSSPRMLQALFAAINPLLVLTTMHGNGMAAMYSISVIGLINSITFPTIFALGVERLGPTTSNAPGLHIMAIVGGAEIPYLPGAFADYTGLQHALFLLLFCCLYIVFYGMRGATFHTLPQAG